MRQQAPISGWRRLLFRLSGGQVNPGLSPAERARLGLVARAKAPIYGYRQIAVLSLKGGEGKTSTAVMLGHTFASVRGDRVVALDAAPDGGTLADRVHSETSASVRDLLESEPVIERYADVRSFTSQAPSRLEVLGAETDAAISEAFDDLDYRRVTGVLSRFYNLIITDCGPGLLHPAMRQVLELADQLVVVTSPTVDGARSGSRTLDWLDAHGYTDLVESGVVVLNAVRRQPLVDLSVLTTHFARRCRAVVTVPWDRHLGTGAQTSLDELSPATRLAYLELAATVADSFAVTPRRSRQKELGGGEPGG
jgi:MinD-like ATPase involved in chromosome partitioning or flagellar assembly